MDSTIMSIICCNKNFTEFSSHQCIVNIRLDYTIALFLAELLCPIPDMRTPDDGVFMFDFLTLVLALAVPPSSLSF